MEQARTYKGIEFIRISELPQDQQEQIRNIVSTDLVIKIKTDSELMSDCIVYNDYVKWYSSIYTKMSPAAEDPVQSKPARAKLLTRLKHRLLPDT